MFTWKVVHSWAAVLICWIIVPLTVLWSFVDASKLWLLKKLNDVHWTLQYHLLDLFDERFLLVSYFYICELLHFFLLLLLWNLLFKN